jgi:hypothetical protein
VTEAQVNRARAIHKQRAKGGGDDEAGNCIFPPNKLKDRNDEPERGGVNGSR